MQESLELIIDEATPGHFFRTLVKQVQAGERPFVIDFAMGPLPSKQAALDAGNACLIRHRSGRWGASTLSSDQAARRYTQGADLSTLGGERSLVQPEPATFRPNSKLHGRPVALRRLQVLDSCLAHARANWASVMRIAFVGSPSLRIFWASSDSCRFVSHAWLHSQRTSLHTAFNVQIRSADRRRMFDVVRCSAACKSLGTGRCCAGA